MDLKDKLISEAYPETGLLNELRSHLEQSVLPTLDERVPAIQIMGSQPKGYATHDSDVDFKLYFYGVSHDEALHRYAGIQKALNDAGWQPCDMGTHIEDRHVVHLDRINASEIIISIIPPAVYSFLCKYDLVWIHRSVRQAMDIADLFAGGFVEHTSMEGYRKMIIDGVLQNEDPQKVWKVVDSLYRGHLSRVSLRRHGFSRSEEKRISRYRRKKFGLPTLDQLATA